MAGMNWISERREELRERLWKASECNLQFAMVLYLKPLNLYQLAIGLVGREFHRILGITIPTLS